MEVKAAMSVALAAHPGLTVIEFSTWPVLFDFVAKRVDPRTGYSQDLPVRPDAFLRIHERELDGGASEHDFFLELDRSTESQRAKLVPKAGSYLDYYSRGGFAERFGGRREDYKHFPFRVLFVVPTAERRNNTAEGIVLTQPGCRNQVWLSTIAEVTADPLGPVWITPAGYEQATRGTSYAPRREQDGPYKTQPDRQDFVEAHVVKRRLLSG
jgi:hypothetical protein